MAHAHIERLNRRVAELEKALGTREKTDRADLAQRIDTTIAKAVSDGQSEADVVKALASLGRDAILDLLYPGASEVQKRLAAEMIKSESGANAGATLAIGDGVAGAPPAPGRRRYGSFAEVVPLTDPTLAKAELEARVAARAKAQQPRRADEERRKRNIEQARTNTVHQGS